MICYIVQYCVVWFFFVYLFEMVEQKEISKVAHRIGKAVDAEKVILFGSHAKGLQSESSDVDLLIIAESSLPRFKRSRELYALFKPHPFAMDLLVYTPKEIKKGQRSKVSFVSIVLKEGKTLYERKP